MRSNEVSLQRGGRASSFCWVFLTALVSAGCTSEVGGGGQIAMGNDAAEPGASNTDAGGAATGSGASSDGASSTDGTGGSGVGSTSGASGGANSSNTSGGSGLPEDLSPVFTCDASAVPESVPLKRLSYAQYRHTLEDLILLALPDSGPAALTELGPALDRLPRDTRQGPDTAFALFDRLDQTVQQVHIDEQYAISNELGRTLTGTSERLAELVGDCAVEQSDAACLTGFIRSFGERAQRRPLEDDDVDFYASAVGDSPYSPEDYADVVALLLASPYAVYAVEHGQDDASGPRVALTAFELASKLSYQFWQTMPDAELFEAARSGELLTDAGYEAAVDRVLSDARAQRGVGEFFSQWLENPFLEELDARVGQPTYDAFLDGYEPTSELRARMLQEVVDAANYSLAEGQSFADFFLSNRSFAVTDDLASIYGVEPWDGGEPPVFGDPAREGLLARAAFLATGLSETRPIIKGVLIRKAILCEAVPPPPAEVANEPPPASDDAQSTRAAVEGKTASGVCRTCHVLFNDLGFATENFDALGRFRTEQRLFDADGEPAGAVPVDTNSIPRIDDGDTTESMGIADVNRLILASDKPYACFARQYFRFTNSRVEHTAKDGCTLSALKDKLTGGASLREVLKTIALTQSFRERTL